MRESRLGFLTEVKKNDVIIRKAEKKDYQRILDILNMAIAGREVTALLTPVTMEGRKQWFKDHEDGIHSIYVAEQDGFVLGWMAINAYRSGREGFRKACELSYYIDSDFHSQGIGSVLMAYVIEISRQEGLKHLMLIVFADNFKSIRLAHKFRFRIWGTFPDIVEIDGRTTDCYQLGLKL